jgi:ubiquinone/menaquinone biosynthesis C-methylase UbiE
MYEDDSVDLLVNIEVLEHVDDIQQAVHEFSRVLRRNGFILFTTPCSNKFSLEWLENLYFNSFEKTKDGFHRFGTDPVEHVRRLTGNEIRQLFGSHGLSIHFLRYRAHFFTRVFHLLSKFLSKHHSGNMFFRLFAEIAYLDWRFFRWLPNGATMVGLARKI